MVYGVGSAWTDAWSREWVRIGEGVNLAHPVLIIWKVNYLVYDLVLVSFVWLIWKFLFLRALGILLFLLVFLVLLLLLLHQRTWGALTRHLRVGGLSWVVFVSGKLSMVYLLGELGFLELKAESGDLLLLSFELAHHLNDDWLATVWCINAWFLKKLGFRNILLGKRTVLKGNLWSVYTFCIVHLEVI